MTNTTPSAAFDGLFAALAEMQRADTEMSDGDLTSSKGLVEFDNAATEALACASVLTSRPDLMSDLAYYIRMHEAGRPE